MNTWWDSRRDQVMSPSNRTGHSRGLLAVASAVVVAMLVFSCGIHEAACAAGIQDLMPVQCRQPSPAHGCRQPL